MRRKRKRARRRGLAAVHGRLDVVVGYFARRGQDVACDGPACLIASTRAVMAELLRQSGRADAGFSIRSTTAGEIVQGLRLGGAYAFDEGAYRRFLPSAQEAGLPLDEADFRSASATGGRRLIHVQLCAASYVDQEGLHFPSAGEAPDAQTLDELTRAYQRQVRQSPLWDAMVAEYGEAKAERMLQNFRAQLRDS